MVICYNIDGWEYENIKSFAGIFPEDDPKYIVYVAAKRIHSKPRNFAEPITTAIEEIASYAKLTQKGNEDTEQKLVSIDNYISKDLNTTKTLLENKNINIITIGDGNYIINQYPLKNNNIFVNGKLFLVTNGSNIIIPDMTNWSKLDAEVYCSLASIPCSFSNYGYINAQSIAPGTLYDGYSSLDFSLAIK